MKSEEIILKSEDILLVDKPLCWTSFDVVKKLRHLLKVKKIGHAGTLDPRATGLLLLCMGKGTKRLSAYQDLDKTYEGQIVLGKTTSSYDLETPFDQIKSYQHLQEADVLAACDFFLGVQTQTPPAYSACKVNGVRAYKRARKGKEVILRPREITIYTFELTKIDLPSIDFVVRCSKGTYIRSLAHDFGQHLGVGGYLSKLRRTRIGKYRIEDAYTIPWLEKKVKAGAFCFSPDA